MLSRLIRLSTSSSRCQRLSTVARSSQFRLSPTIAWALLDELEDAGLKPGQPLVVTAAASAVGRFLLQEAVVRRYTVVAVVRHESQRALLEELGASRVVLAANDLADDALTAAVRGDLGSAAPKFALDGVGGGRISLCVQRALASGGLMIVFGSVADSDLVLDVRRLTRGAVRVVGFSIDNYEDRKFAMLQLLKQQTTEAMLMGAAKAQSEPFEAHRFVEALKHARTSGKTKRTVLEFSGAQ